jgi:hypothetical protein
LPTDRLRRSLSIVRRSLLLGAIWVSLYALAMALVEAAVVVYLRALYPVDGPLAALHAVIPHRLLVIEAYREAATILMLFAVAVLAGRGAWQRFLFFSLAFGIWDILYYGWLWVFLRWPPSPLTWDVLFLIPVPWIAPVLAPVIVSVCLVAGSLWLLSRQSRETGAAHGLPRLAWALAGAGAALILLSFTLDSGATPAGGQPPGFRWGLFASGIALGLIGMIAEVRRAR